VNVNENMHHISHIKLTSNEYQVESASHNVSTTLLKGGKNQHKWCHYYAGHYPISEVYLIHRMFQELALLPFSACHYTDTLLF